MKERSQRRFEFLNVMWQFFHFRWKAVIYLNSHTKQAFLINRQIRQSLRQSEVILVLILYISEFILNLSLLLLTYLLHAAESFLRS